VLYGADGLRYASAALDFKYAQRLLVADLTGDDAAEIAIAPAGAKYLEIYDSRARLLQRPRSPFYITDLDSCRLGDAHDELVVYVYPNASGRGTFYWLDGLGDALRQWEYDAVSGFDVVCGGDRPLLVTQEDGAYRILGPEGREIASLPAQLSDHFADLQAAPWRGGWVILATGSGYHAYHMLSIFDAAGDLVYQETGKGWARDLAIPDPDGAEFLIAVGSEVWKYTL
jgi:hypothetical protein